MTKTADPDTVLATRCVTILRHHGKPMDSVHMSRLLGEDSSTCYRVMMKSGEIEHEKANPLTKFRAKGSA